MGDRAHVYVTAGEESGVWLYSHWGGRSLPGTVASALARGARWDDPPYLTRIIFSEMIKEDVMGETGYGISATPTDMGDGGRVVCVDIQAGTVHLRTNSGVGKTYRFQEFVDEKPGWGVMDEQ